MENIRVAKGEQKAQLVLKNAKYLNVFTKTIEVGDIAINNGVIVGVGESYVGNTEIILNASNVVIPSYIDSHVHIESSKLSVAEFSKVLLAHGVSTIITDPHELANVCGVKGINYLIKASKVMPLNIKVMLPSCVPSTPFETNGKVLTLNKTKKLIKNKNILGLAEFMNYVGVINYDSIAHGKLKSAKSSNKIIDGHAPTLKGKELNSYVLAGVKTDHECVSVQECVEKVKKGMYVMLREGSQAKNMLDLLPAVNDNNIDRFLLCTDDRSAKDLYIKGSIDYLVKKLVKNGVEPIKAISLALNGYKAYNLQNLGAVAVGYDADLTILDGLETLNAIKVIKNGKIVAENGKILIDVQQTPTKNLEDSVKIKPFLEDTFKIYTSNDSVKVIKVIENEIITKKEEVKVQKESDNLVLAKKNNLLKIAVVERHHKTGNIGKGFITNYGLKNGAIASTISHDSHNVIVIGDSDSDMLLAVNEIKNIGGGLVLVENGKVKNKIPLQIAGLMTKSKIEPFIKEYEAFIQDAYSLGVNKKIEPIISMSFLALPVIPELKITDKGLFDVNKFEFTSI